MLLACSPRIGAAQILKNQGQLFEETNFFNQEFIRDNKIKAIKGSVADKADLKPIKDLGLRHEYYFNEDGLLTGMLEEVVGASGTIVQLLTLFEYNELGNVVVKRGSDLEGFYSWHYEYNSAGFLIRETYHRETNKGSSSEDFELDRQIKVFSETFEYPVATDKQQKKVFYNREGKEYKTLMSYWNEYGNLSEKLEVFTVTNRKQTKTYSYDEKHRLGMLTDKSSHGSTMEHQYSYDAMGFVEAEAITRNGKPNKEIEYMYDKATYLLTARLIRDEDTASIRIIQYETEFFE